PTASVRPEKAAPHPGPLMPPADYPRQVGKQKFAPVDLNDTKLRMECRERIISDLRLRSADRRKERGLSGIRQADQTGIGDQFQTQADRAFLAWLPWIGVPWRAIGGRLEMCVSEAAIAALGNCRTLADLREIRQQGLAVFFVDLGPDGHFQNDILAIGTGAVLPHAITAALRLEVLLEAI